MNRNDHLPDLIASILNAASPHVPMPNPAPCTCGAYPFPHRPNGGDCATWWHDEAEREYQDEQHQRDLSAWAALSRG